MGTLNAFFLSAYFLNTKQRVEICNRLSYLETVFCLNPN